MRTPILYHGPGALKVASEKPGNMLGWMGASGLTVGETRELLALLQHPRKRGVLLLGPLDEGTKEALDALLKTLEEPPEHIELRLFAGEEGRVPATIRSRCVRYFCGLPRGTPSSSDRRLLAWAVAGRVGELAEVLLQSKVAEPLPSLEVLAAGLLEHGEASDFVRLWSALRVLPRDYTRVEVFAALTALRR